jgi:hypothetical protein
VANFPEPPNSNYGLWSKHSDANGDVLPAAQQLIAFRQDVSGTDNIVARRYDGSGPISVTNLASTCSPSQNPRCSGSRYRTYLLGWLPTDNSAQTIRVLYALREWTYVNGTETNDSVTHRVTTLDTSSWPSATVANDDPLAFAGDPVTALNLVVSRDGTLASYDENFEEPSNNYVHVAPLEYDPVTGTTTLRSDIAEIRGDANGTGHTVHYAGDFSPDNSQLVMTGVANNMQSVFVADATVSGPPAEVDGNDQQADSPIWGP